LLTFWKSAEGSSRLNNQALSNPNTESKELQRLTLQQVLLCQVEVPLR
jgi:hypothetical protein